MVRSRFETLRMESGETIKSYFTKILDMANEASVLGEPISNKNLVSKALRSPPETFNVKISSIEEAHNTATMDLNHLMSILMTHELNMNHQKSLYNMKDVSRNVTDNVGTSSSAVQEDDDDDDDLEEIDDDANIVLLIRTFNSMIRKIKRRNFKSKEQSPDCTPKKSIHPSRAATSKNSVIESRYAPEDMDTIQCRACKGFEHYANECANILRKQGKAMMVSISDGEEKVEENEERARKGVVIKDVSDENDISQSISTSSLTEEKKGESSIGKESADNVEENVLSTSGLCPTNSELGSQEEHESSKEIQGTEIKDSSSRIRKNHPISQVIGGVEEGVKSR